MSSISRWVTPSVRRLGPLLVALLPMCIGLIFSDMGPRPTSAEAPRARPPLAFHHYQVNLGKVPPQRDHFARFGFTNHSEDTIELRKLETSCGCLTQHQAQKTFAPGQHGEFFLRIQSANQEPGAKHYTCKAIYGPVGKPDVEFATDLRFLITLPELTVVVRPRVLVFHQPNARPTTHVVTITDLRDKPLQILGAACEDSFVTVRLKSGAELEALERTEGIVGKLEVTVGEVPPGRHECEIRVRTDDREFNLLRVPLRVHGPEAKRDRSRPVFEPADASDDDPLPKEGPSP